MSRFHSLVSQLAWFRPIFSTYLSFEVTSETIVVATATGETVTLPTILVWHRQTQNIVAVGEAAVVLEGKHPANLEVVRPVVQGKVANTQALVSLLATIMQQQLAGHTHSWLIKPHIRLAVVPELSTVDASLWEHVFLQAGAQSVQLVTRSQAGFETLQRQNFGKNICTVEILEDVSVVACFVQAKPVFEKKITFGLQSLRLAVRSFLRESFQLEISHQELRALLTQSLMSTEPIGIDRTAQPTQRVIVRGKNLVTGLPTTVKIEVAAMAEVATVWSELIATKVSQVLAQLDAGVVTEILETGLVIYGPGSRVQFLHQSLASQCQCQIISLQIDEVVVMEGLRQSDE